MNIIINTDRLNLRAFEEKDALSKIHIRQKENDHIAVCLKDTDQLIGEISL